MITDISVAKPKKTGLILNININNTVVTGGPSCHFVPYPKCNERRSCSIYILLVLLLPVPYGTGTLKEGYQKSAAR